MPCQTAGSFASKTAIRRLIDVFSEIGKGKTFKIFPRVEQGLSRSAQRVLVVDDDISIRKLITEMLTRSGFEVDAAAGRSWLGGASDQTLSLEDGKLREVKVERVTRLELATSSLARKCSTN
jgi:hypothetical protein